MSADFLARAVPGVQKLSPYVTGKPIDELARELGIEPARYAAYKALTGDTADNIRGIPKIGPKTAAELMNQFGSLEAMFAGAEQIRKPSVRESVLRNQERIRLNALLIRLDSAEKLPFDLDEMVYRDSGYATTDVLKGIGLR